MTNVEAQKIEIQSIHDGILETYDAMLTAAINYDELFNELEMKIEKEIKNRIEKEIKK